jgi:triacylglycerol esterase/lipase EstA (alpha/beta hydrolase family)
MPSLSDRAFTVSVVDGHGKAATGALVRIFRAGRLKAEGSVQPDGSYLFQVGDPKGTLEIEVIYADFRKRQEVRADEGSVVITIAGQGVRPDQGPVVVTIPKRAHRYFWPMAGVAVIAVVIVILLGRRLIPFIDPLPFDIESEYVGQPPHNKPVAVVFVHGIFGTKNDSWVNKGKSFPTLLATDPRLEKNVDVFLFEYFTPKFSTAASIVGLADQLRGSLEDNRVFEDHQQVVFLSHSMGGIIVRQFLLTKRDRVAKVPMLYFYATPTNGSELTEIAKQVSSNPQLRGMLPLEGNDLLQSIQSGWLGGVDLRRIPSYCAYETLPTDGVNIVSISSATALCNQDLDPITADHIEIVKPKDRSDRRYTRFVSALHRSVPHAENEVAQFAPSAALTQSKQEQLNSALEQYAKVLTNLGLAPKFIPIVHVEDTLPEPRFNSYIRGNDIFVQTDHARPANVLREYSHAVLLEPFSGDRNKQWAYSAIEAGIASYLTADCLNSPIVDDVDLDRRFPISNIPHTWQGGQDAGSRAWGSFLWALREKFGPEKVNLATVRAWKNVQPTSSPGDYQKLFLEALVSAGLDSSTVKTLLHR